MSFWVEFGGEDIKNGCVLRFPNQNYSLNWFRNRLKENDNLMNLELKVNLIKSDLDNNKIHLGNNGFIKYIEDIKPTKIEEVDDFIDNLQRLGEMIEITKSIELLEEFIDLFKNEEDMEKNFKKILIKIKEKKPKRYMDIPEYLL